MRTQGIRTRLTIAVVLAVCAFGLVAAVRFTSEGDRTPQHPRVEKETVRRVVEDVLARNGVEKKLVKTWDVRVRDGGKARTEQRVIVPRDFVSIKFNHELSLALAPYEARVIATERTKERTVTMHIVSNGEVIYTLSLRSP